MSSSGSESDSNESEEEIKCSLKIKHRNRVKKINELPDKFAKLNNIIKKKYEDFKEGKPTYTMCYLDEENELINISDEEDYCVFKDHVRSNHLSSAKVFLTNKGEERNFDPLLEANRTICESMIMDEADAYPKTFRAVPERVLGQSVSEQASQQMLELIRKQLDYLVQKDKQEEIEKAQAKAKKEEAKRAKLEKQEVLKKKKKEKEDKKKLKEEKKKLKDKEKKKAKKEEKDGKEKKEKKEGEGKERADSLWFLSEELGNLKEKLEPGVEQIGVIDQDTQNVGEQEKHEFSIQPVLKRKDDKKPEGKNAEVIPEPKNVEIKPEPEIVEMKPEPEPKLSEVKPKEEQKEIIEEVKVLEVQAEKDSLCAECKSKLNGKTYYICSICSQYNICEKWEYDSQHQHVFIKLPVGAKFDAREYDEFWQKLLGMFSDNLVEESDIQEAIINQSKNWLPLKIKPMNLKKAQILRKDKYKDGLFVKRGELVEIEWEVKNLTNSDWPNNVTIECLPSSDIFINEQLTNLVLKKGEKSSISVKFYAPKEIFDKEVLDVNLCLFDETKTAIGEELKIKLTILE